MRFTFATLAVLHLTVTLSAQEAWTPPRFQTGSPPETPVVAVSGGEVFLEVTVSATGVVGHINVLKATPPFTDTVLDAVRGWTFLPAERTEAVTSGTPPAAVTELVSAAVESKVFVAAVFRPPSFYTPTLGAPPTESTAPTADVAVPVSSATPGFPPQALQGGTVLTEVTVGVDGGVTHAEVIRPASGFDDAALGAARQWSFRPARVGGRIEETYAYIAFSFRPPLTNPLPPRR